MMNHRLNLHVALFLAAILACSGFTTTSPSRTTSTTTLAGPNHRQPQQQQQQQQQQHQTYSNRPSILQRQVRLAHAAPRDSSTLLLASTSGDGDESSSTSAEDAAAAAAAVPTWKLILMSYKYNDDGTLKSKSKGEETFKQKLAKMGLSALLSYGFVSNMSYTVTVSLAWFGFSKKTGLSPLAPGQWKGFLAVYAGFYVFNNFIRPMRLAVSIGVTPYFDRAVAAIQRKTKLSKSASIGIVVFLANICGTTSLMSLGIYIASLAAGVPIFPPKV